MISVTNEMVRVARTLISGLTPRRTLEKITMGSVLLPGPEAKLEITRSSHDMVKASSQPDRMAGKMIGRVMTKNTLAGCAPRSMAASSRAMSNVPRRDWMTTATNAMEKVMCAMVMVVMPRPAGQPKTCSIATKVSRSDRPVITSGMTSGAVVMALNSMRPRNLPNLDSEKPASVPRMDAPVALITATFSEIQAASRISSLLNRAKYHLSVGELCTSHTVTSLEALKENTTIDRIGRYRKAKPKPSAHRMNRDRRSFTCGLPPLHAPGCSGTTS